MRISGYPRSRVWDLEHHEPQSACPSGGAGGFPGVHQVAQLLGRLEVGHLLRRNLDALAALGVASNARIALANTERPKAANLNLVAALERADHRVEDRLDNDFAVAPRQVARAGHLFHQVCLCHIVFASALSITGFGPSWHEKIAFNADSSLFSSTAWRNRPRAGAAAAQDRKSTR